ncbi:hypothetical protein LPJ53_005387 [Coemansia erecta]|uniref:Uncharacterized protein n=1 Tax=Coemansia erecta TaxID=147472 RepID=A0A9W7XVV2_9FUNG|nr:hypothetical protein LPJ53_005387 [Coemansia erecta]
MVSMSAYHTPGVNGRKTLGKASPLANSFSLIEYNKDLRFLIMDCPTNSTIPLYLKDLPFKDGDVPVIALIEKGSDPLDAIEHVRRKRRGAFNNRQITYLADSYKRSSGSKSSVKIGSAIRQSPLTSGGSPQSSTNSPGGSTHPLQPPNASSSAGGSAGNKPNSTSSTASASKSLFKKIFGSH